MKLLRLLFSVILVAAVTKPSLPVGPPIGFRTQINSLNSMNVPYTGALVIRVSNAGVIRGDYESDSVRPDPLYGRLTPVTGTVSGTRVLLQIGTGLASFSITGTVTGRGISGSATQRGQIWTFNAVRVHLRNPPTQT